MTDPSLSHFSQRDYPEIEMDFDDDSFCCNSNMDESEDESLSLDSFSEDMFQDQDTPEADEKKPSLSTSASVLLQLINALNDDLATSMDLTFPIADGNDLPPLLDAIRSSTSVTECTVSNECFQSLSIGQRKELAFALSELPVLKSLILDSVFPEFLYTLNFCRCWKRDQYYQQNQRYCEFENRTIQELKITNIPSDIPEAVLGNVVMMAVSNFACLQRLDMTFASDFEGPQAVLTRVALGALRYSNGLGDVKIGFEDDFGDYVFMMEVDTTRNENIMRVLKVRCGDDNLSDHCYTELSHMLKANSRTLQGLVLDTAVDNALVLANALGQNNNLKALCLGTFDCQDKSSRDGLLSLVSQVLFPPYRGGRQESSLDYLSLVCQEMDDQGVEQLSKAFAQSSLRELMLFLDNETDGAISTEAIAALAKVFQANETIEEFSLICHSLDDDGLIAFANALNVNDSTLRKLKLQCSKGLNVSPKGYQAVINMLQTNTTLEMFDLSRCPGAEGEDDHDDDDENDDFFEVESLDDTNDDHLKYQPEIEYYLNLNQSGVRDCQLHIDATPKEFRTLLLSQRHDLNTLYYMLSTNPSFIAYGT